LPIAYLSRKSTKLLLPIALCLLPISHESPVIFFCQLPVAYCLLD